MNKTLSILKERIYETAVAFKEATEDPTNGKWVESARWAEYTTALTAHADYLVTEYKQSQAEGTE